VESTDTICALATAPGKAGVAIIRVAGPDAHELGQRITHQTLTPRYAHCASFYDQDGGLLDQGIAIYFPKPQSFTGDETVELHTHGNPHICQSVLNALTRLGARLAIAGEFSERAFLNGKMDLAQLEAVADLIASGSEKAARSAVLSMQGRFSDQVHQSLQALIRIRTHIEASLDFSDEDIETETRTKVGEQLAHSTDVLDELFATAQQGVQLQQGATVVFTGRPNVGKSSLFNALCAEERAIVTSVPGTTRDVVRADIQLNGMPIHLLDTAGIREQAEVIEQEGIKRAQTAIDQADLVILVTDNPQHQDEAIVDRREIRVLNKIDLVNSKNTADEFIKVSAKTGEGLQTLRNQILLTLGISEVAGEPPFSARMRHLEALQRCKIALSAAHQHIQNNSPLELAAEELRLAQQSLAEITGEFSPDDLLDYIFREFCIGK
jgi:tRNA modification GTPase